MKRSFVLCAVLMISSMSLFATLYQDSIFVEYHSDSEQPYVRNNFFYYHDLVSSFFNFDIFENRIELENWEEGEDKTIYFNKKVDVWIEVFFDGPDSRYSFQVRLVGTSTDKGSVVVDGKAGMDFVQAFLNLLTYPECDGLNINLLVRGTGDERHIEYRRYLYCSKEEIMDSMSKLFPALNQGQQ